MTIDSLQFWRDEFLHALAVLRRAGDYLTAPPANNSNGAADADPAKRVKMLLLVRQALGLDDLQLRPAHTAAKCLADAVAGQSARDMLAESIRRAADGIDHAIAGIITGLPSSEVHALGLIRTADFGGAGDGALIVTLNGNVVAAGLLQSLPPDHPLRAAVPADAAYRLEIANRPPAASILLGPPDAGIVVGPATARRFYTVDAALSLTRRQRNHQRQRDQERADQERGEQEQHARNRELAALTPHALREKILVLESKLNVGKGGSSHGR